MNGPLQYTLTFGTYLTGTSFNNSGSVTLATNAASANTASAIVARDGSGNFSAGTITATLTGTATQVSTDLSLSTYLSYTSGSTYNGSAARTIQTNAVSANTASTLVARDGSGNFSAGTITATLTGTASALVTGNNYQVSSFGVGTPASGTAGEIRATNDITAFYSSDKRLKENINPIPNALQKLSQISGNTFDWKSGFSEIHSHSGTDVGVIAQEVEKVLPQVVTTRENGYKAVQYEKIIALLIEAVKELQEEVNQLKGK